jgi:hypothetical protein
MTKTMKSLVQNIFAHQDNWKIKLLQNWPDILGNLSTKVHLEKINDDSLVLGVADSCWMQELYMLSPLLLRTINKKLDAPRINSLRFKKVGIKKEKKQKTYVRKKQHFIAPPLLPKEQQALKKIKDPALSAAIQNFLRRCQQEI